MEFDVFSQSDVGCVRTNNEDAYFVSPDHGLFVVCDGMGGHNAGEVASQLSCKLISSELCSTRVANMKEKFEGSGHPEDLRALQRTVEQAVSSACRAIFEEAMNDPAKAGMGTTCTVVLFAGRDKAVLAHVGDSRLYLVRGEDIHQISEDHTYVNELVKRGLLKKSEAHDHPQGNVLSRAMGVQPNVAIDTMLFDIDADDTLLLCSDGLYNYYPEAKELIPTLKDGDIRQSLGTLVNTAKERGGHDNITGVVIRIKTGEIPVAAAERLKILKKIAIFSHLQHLELMKVLGTAQMAKVNQGDNLITEGEVGDVMYVVVKGEVDIIKGEDVLTTLPAGVHLGEMALVDNAPRSATARARTDLDILLIRRDEFFNIVRAEPVIATKLLWSLVQVLSGRLRQTNAALEGARRELAGDIEGFEILFDDDDE